MAKRARQETLRDFLEDFAARLLAANTSDADSLGRLHERLSRRLDAPRAKFPPQARDALKLIAEGVDSIAERPRDAAKLLGACAATATAVAERGDNDETRQAVEIAAGLLKDLLASSELTAPAPRKSASAPADRLIDATEVSLAQADADEQAPEEPTGPPSQPPAKTREAPAEAQPAASAAQSLAGDPEILRDFIAESTDRIAAAEASLLTLEAGGDDPEHINTVLRSFHTVKGASGFLGFDRIQELAHRAENLLIKARDGGVRIVGDRADAALAACDALQGMIRALDPSGREAEAFDESKTGEAIKTLERVLADGQGPAEPSSPPEASPEDVQESPSDEPEDKPTKDRPPKEASSVAVRVSAERLDELVNMVGEMVVTHSIISESSAVVADADGRLGRSVSRAGKILRSLQDLTLGLRMVPLRGTMAKMARLVRDVSRQSGKSVRLVTEGEDTEIDRNMVEALSDPLIHMIRNAVDHGIETETEREAAGKSPEGTIHLRAHQAAGSVVIELSDDGRGLCRDKIVAKAVERGLLSADRDPGEAEALSLIFHPGLSTAEKVSRVSGRGVGMDVVKRGIDGLRGKIEVRSRRGEGTTFAIRLPLTLAIADAMMVRVGSQRYLLPTTSIVQTFRPAAGDVRTVAGRGEMVRVRSEMLPVFRLGALFGVDDAEAEPDRAILIVIDSSESRCAVLADELLGQQQVVIKSLGSLLAKTPGVSGGAILGDGRLGLILDPTGLMELSRGRAVRAA